MADAKEQHAAVELVDAGEGTVRRVRRNDKGIPRDVSRLRSGRCERKRMIASTRARHAPERVWNDAEHFSRPRRLRVEHVLIRSGPRRRDDSARWTDALLQGVNQTLGSTFDRTHRAKRSVHEQHVADGHAEGAELLDHLLLRWFVLHARLPLKNV